VADNTYRFVALASVNIAALVVTSGLQLPKTGLWRTIFRDVGAQSIGRLNEGGRVIMYDGMPHKGVPFETHQEAAFFGYTDIASNRADVGNRGSEMGAVITCSQPAPEENSPWPVLGRLRGAKRRVVRRLAALLPLGVRHIHQGR
jgi:hypothetical protein